MQHVAAQDGCIDALRALLEGPGAALRSSVNLAGHTLLHSAAFKGRAEAVALLLAAGLAAPGEVLAADTSGDTPLHRALNGVRPDREKHFNATIRVLLAAGANPL